MALNARSKSAADRTSRIKHNASLPIIQQRQAWLTENDRRLPDAFKHGRESRPLSAIEAEYAGKWLAVLPTRIDPTTARVTDGRFVAAASNRKALERLIAPLLEALPNLRLFTYPTKRDTASLQSR